MKNRHVRPAVMAAMLLIAVAGAGCGGGGPSPEMELGGINTGEVLKGLLARTERALAGVQDMASAQAAAAELDAINDDFDDLIYHVPKLSEKGRAEMGQKARKALPDLEAMAARIGGMPGLDEILGPSMNTMVDKIKLLL